MSWLSSSVTVSQIPAHNCSGSRANKSREGWGNMRREGWENMRREGWGNMRRGGEYEEGGWGN